VICLKLGLKFTSKQGKSKKDYRIRIVFHMIRGFVQDKIPIRIP